MRTPCFGANCWPGEAAAEDGVEETAPPHGGQTGPGVAATVGQVGSAGHTGPYGASEAI